jgi:hypothetical protein
MQMSKSEMVLVAVVFLGLAGIGIGAQTYMEHVRPEGHNTAYDAQVIAVLTLLGGMFLNRVLSSSQIHGVEKKADIAASEARSAREQIPAQAAEKTVEGLVKTLNGNLKKHVDEPTATAGLNDTPVESREKKP